MPRSRIRSTTGCSTRPLHLLDGAGGQPGQRRVGAHAAGVRALVAVVGALVVLRGQQRDDGGAVGDREQRHLGPVEVLLDDEPPAEVGQRVAGEVLRDGEVDAHVDALAGSEPVGLDDVRRRRAGEVRDGLLGVVEHDGRRGRDARLAHDLLGEGLAALELGRGRGRPEARDAGRAHRVRDAGDERSLRPDDDEVEALRERDDGGGVGEVDGRARRRAGVAGGADHLVDGRVAGEREDEGVLAGAAAEDEDLHGGQASGGP